MSTADMGDLAAEMGDLAAEMGDSGAPVWSGTVVRDRLGITLTTAPGSLLPVDALVGLAVRRNPKRAQLLVSRVLAKHVPTPPGLAIGAGRVLGAAVALRLGLPWDAGRDALEAAAKALLAWLEGTPPSCLEVLPLPAAPPAAGEALATLGYAETATGLGHLVAEFLGSYYVHSTRIATPVPPFGGFEEEHSHATSHAIVPTDPERLARAGTVVLVDDELSTGRTVLNTVRELHAAWARAASRAGGPEAGTHDGDAPGAPQARRRYVVATLVDLRSDEDRRLFDGLADELGCELAVVALGRGSVGLPDDVLERAAEWLAEAPGSHLDGQDPHLDGQDPHFDGQDPHLGGQDPHLGGQDPHLGGVVHVRVPAGGPGEADGSDGLGPVRSARFGVDTSGPHGPRLAELALGPAAAALRALVDAGVGRDARILVLGSEEHLALPLAVADELAFRLDAGHARPPRVHFSSTTRSPVHVHDHPGYAVRSALTFASHDHAVDGAPATGRRAAYNVAAGTGGDRFDAVVYLPEPGTGRGLLDTPGLPGTPADGEPSATEALARAARNVVVLHLDAAAPYPEPLRGSAHGPADPAAFGSYAPEDVSWLLTDLSGAQLEAPAHEREAAIQSGRASYAESLPQEYEPSEQYQALFHDALAESAHRIAAAVADVTEQVLALRDREPVLVSLARAGTPVGILMRRWARHAHGLDVPHYTMSIVRGLGIDRNALRWLLTRHRPDQIMFVDGWTGKGAIARELASAVAEFNAAEFNAAELPAGAHSGQGRLSPELAVLADPGHCVRVFGTRDDFLIPSACLNSTVSGLVSRTVFNRELIGPHDFHGAKFYRELAGRDVSREFVDAVEACFTAVGTARAEGTADTGAAAPASGPWGTGTAHDAEPTWAGWAAVERIAAEQGMGPGPSAVNLVKPGVGETTRVLLRRVPWKVLARPELLERDDAGRLLRGELAHVLLLAEQRGVPVEPVEGLPYSCVGLIHPKYTPGATGADGKTVLDV
ncbi:phosphoribosyltransferase domain-containing protein [Sinomonas halotolerans]|uniref:Phosphoribosyltransferase domain-containing protein n=1 Tax=Sinomonas halotolerans TaxID=1644133 RepID=A0ABU9WZC0_9MICC